MVFRRVMRHVWVKEKERSSSGRHGQSCRGDMTAHTDSVCRVSPGRVIFEIGGVPVREELAREGVHYA